MQLKESSNASNIPDFQRFNSEVYAISFLISTYNRAPFVDACVRHLLSIQTPYSIEIIVRDNASEDNTKSVIEAINDPRLRYVRAPRNQGTISFLEVGRLARGEIITWLSDEDDFEFQHLDYVIEIFKNDPACSVMIGSVTVGPNSTEVIFPETVIFDDADALISTLQFSGCGGVFIRGELFRLNCDIHPTNQQEAYQLWNYYPISFFATCCIKQKLITTNRIVVRQTRQAPTTDDWSKTGDASAITASLQPHYYPNSICDRLYSNLITIFMEKSTSLWVKFKVSKELAARFVGQINNILHPGLIQLLCDNYPKSTVDVYKRYLKKKTCMSLYLGICG